MDTLTILLLAVGLAMDCFAVAFSEGLHPRQSVLRVLLMVILFALFQGGMPLITYFVGSFFFDLICRYAPWIALLLLLAVGGQMLWNAYRHTVDEEEKVTPVRSWVGHILILAVATSIDALSVGILFVPFPDCLLKAALMIAAVAALFTLVGYALGNRLGGKLPFAPDWIAGSILILLGLKIWLSAMIN